MAELHLTRGLPGCGKTTFAKRWVGPAGTEENRVRINRDDLRFAIFGRYWPVDEKVITAAQQSAVRAALRAGTSVIIDDTNLRQRDLQAWVDLGYKVDPEITIHFHDMTDVPLALCIERDRKRQEAGDRFVGHSVIVDKYNRFIKGKQKPVLRGPRTFRTYVPNHRLPPAYIVDLDGTLARMNGRSPYDWKRVGEDELVEPVAKMVQDLATGTGLQIVVMSGRDGSCRPQTEDWLALNNVCYDYLIMRAAGDKRSDDIVKEELFFDYVAPRWCVRAAIDDRNRVVAMWRSLGLLCLQVADGDF